MSTITTFPQAASQVGKMRLEQKSVPVHMFQTDKPGHSDEDMMYAWSIGVTSAGREMASAHEDCREECPPEVYIG